MEPGAFRFEVKNQLTHQIDLPNLSPVLAGILQLPVRRGELRLQGCPFALLFEEPLRQ